ncbi:choice-of-anchor Q domain-containing protein [Amaricoccus sp.]|uniref:choice-of-anchor Q domain-containing protein n=1 Tax=Amaricoccus sp. TaxID=1872485 RepID=UPI001B797FB8|nr:choice-of-anchor Q domain-containing protein [Amaricoccus sp.]MBP6999933.1 hypothetical protein [Amaricoccus sp.]
MATFIVTTSDDSGAGSLREAVLAANASAGADEIRFDETVFDGGAEDLIRLTSGQIEITDELAIVGGPAGVTITGDAAGDDVTLAGGITDLKASGTSALDDNTRIFHATGALTIEGLTLTGGVSQGENEHGGAVAGTQVTVRSSTLSGNSTLALSSLRSEPGGGAIFAKEVTFENSTATSNGTFTNRGGAILATSVIVDNSTLSDNVTRSGSGGAIAAGSVSITGSTLVHNLAGGYGNGGSIYSTGDVLVVDSTISGSSADDGGGILAHGFATLVRSVVSDNRAFGVSLYGIPGQGGGIDAWGGISLTDSSVRENRAHQGAGINSDGDITLTNSTVSGNYARGNYAGGGIKSRGAVTLVNSTISGNSTYSFARYGGGGIAANGLVTLISSTVTGNSAADYAHAVTGGGILSQTDVRASNSIVSGNATPPGIYDPDGTGSHGPASEISGPLTLLGGNIIGDAIFDGAAQVGSVTAAEIFVATTEIAPGVVAGVLADNGGPTQTVAIRADGPAAGAADPATATATDQRGVARDAAPDLGAFEAAREWDLTLVGGSGDDELVGGAGADRLRGRGGDDLLIGRAGDDWILGDKGCDTICAGAGDDLVHGGKGRDRIDGGTGDDVLHGGKGGDVFVFGAGFGDDRILDFGNGPDRIDLRRLGITAASFADEVTISQDGADALVAVAGHGTIRTLGVYAGHGDGLDAGDFLLLA